jgi:ABC-2 type transport system ATP-binding protein
MIPVLPSGLVPVLPKGAEKSDRAIELCGLTKTYGPARGVEDLTLVVPSNCIFGCLGPNGSGKTTTIRIMLDLVRRTKGSVQIFGLDPGRSGARLRECIGYLPGELGLPDTMTAEEALRFYGNLSGGQTPLRDWACEVLGLPQSILRSRLRFFSKGMKQKVGLVQAIQHAPGLLILDEPTTGLDPVMQARLFSALNALRCAGVTVFFSSHILTEVQSLCDRVAVLREGRLLLEGPVGEVLQTGRRALYIRRSGHFAEVPPEISGAELVTARRSQGAMESSWWTYRTEARHSATVLARLAELQPEDFRLETLVEDSFLELYGLKPGEEP